MSNTLTINGLVNLNNNSLVTQGTLTNKVLLSSLNNLGGNQQITGSVWTSINSGSAPNLRYFFAANNDISASVLLSVTSASAADPAYFSKMFPGDTLLIPYSGSTGLWAKTTGAYQNSASILQYIWCAA